MRTRTLFCGILLGFLISLSVGSMNAGAFGGTCEDQIFRHGNVVPNGFDSCSEVKVVGYLCPTKNIDGTAVNRCQCYYSPALSENDFSMTFTDGGCTAVSACSCNPKFNHFDKSDAFTCYLAEPNNPACRFAQSAKAIFGGIWLINGFELNNNNDGCPLNEPEERMFYCTLNQSCQQECEACVQDSCV